MCVWLIRKIYGPSPSPRGAPIGHPTVIIQTVNARKWSRYWSVPSRESVRESSAARGVRGLPAVTYRRRHATTRPHGTNTNRGRHDRTARIQIEGVDFALHQLGSAPYIAIQSRAVQGAGSGQLGHHLRMPAIRACIRSLAQCAVLSQVKSSQVKSRRDMSSHVKSRQCSPNTLCRRPISTRVHTLGQCMLRLAARSGLLPTAPSWRPVCLLEGSRVLCCSARLRSSTQPASCPLRLQPLEPLSNLP